MEKYNNNDLKIFAHMMEDNGANPATIARILNNLLSLFPENYFDQLAEAVAALQHQGDSTNEPNRWTDFITDLGNIASLLYQVESFNKPLQALNNLANEANNVLNAENGQTTR